MKLFAALVLVVGLLLVVPSVADEFRVSASAGYGSTGSQVSGYGSSGSSVRAGFYGSTVNRERATPIRNLFGQLMDRRASYGSVGTVSVQTAQTTTVSTATFDLVQRRMVRRYGGSR